MRRLLSLCALPLLALNTAEAGERLTWLVRDLPPFTIHEGQEKGQGVIDQLLARLIEQMPEYHHDIVRVNRPRGIQMLQDASLACDPTLLWTADRARFVSFSQPSLPILSSGVIVRRRDMAALGLTAEQSSVDLGQLLSGPDRILGVVAGRSYGQVVDALLGQLPEATLSRHYGNDATANLLQMQQLGRLQLVLGYWPEARYLLQQQASSVDQYVFLSIKGTQRYQLMHVGCSDTPQGRAAIARIDSLLPHLREQVLFERYAKWLDPNMRQRYLQQAPRLLQAQGSTDTDASP